MQLERRGRAATRPARWWCGAMLRTCSITFSSHRRSTRAVAIGDALELVLVVALHVLHVPQPVVDQAVRGRRRARRECRRSRSGRRRSRASTFSTSTANCSTDRQFRSVWTTTLATLRWTNSSPGSRPTISLAGTRLSEQPIHRYSGACWPASRVKNAGSRLTRSAAQARLLSSKLRQRIHSPIMSIRAAHHPRRHRPLLVNDGGLDRIEQRRRQGARSMIRAVAASTR